MQIKLGSGIAQIATLTLAAASFMASAHAADSKVRNTPPVISGSAPTTVVAGQMYVFQPMASDANSDALTFSATGKPAWTHLDRATGRLSGRPTNADVGVYEEIEFSVSDGKSRTRMPKFSLTVAADPKLGRAPSISGTPATTVNAGTAYSFQPAAMDMDGDKLTFSMKGSPVWATLDKTTGRLTGTPTAEQVGTYPGIEIIASDGMNRSRLTRFSITVTAPQAAAANRSLRVSWLPPTENTNGTALTTLNGYRIMYGTAPGQYTKTIDVKTAGITSYMLEGLQPGTYYVTVTATTSTGVESAPATEANGNLT